MVVEGVVVVVGVGVGVVVVMVAVVVVVAMVVVVVVERGLEGLEGLGCCICEKPACIC